MDPAAVKNSRGNPMIGFNESSLVKVEAALAKRNLRYETVIHNGTDTVEESDDNGLYNSGDKTQGMPTIGEKGEPGKWSRQEGGMPVMESSTMERRRYRLKQSQMETVQAVHSIQEGIKKMDKGENPYITKKQQTITEHQTKFFEEATKELLD